MFTNLIELYNVKEVEGGKISQTNSISRFYNNMENRMGEILDVWNVVNGRKMLAALDLSSKGRKFLSTLDKKLINCAITITNNNITQDKVVVLHNNTKDRMYLKTIVAKKENIDLAIKLMYVLWCYSTDDTYKYHFWIGVLLGYRLENILFFLKRNYNVRLSNTDIMDYYVELHDLKPDISKLNVSVLSYIPPL